MNTRSAQSHAGFRAARSAVRWNLAVALGSTLGQGALAGAPTPPPDYGFNFATVDHPGNAPTQTFPRPGFPTLTVGGVDHVYRIATTEVTNRQWFDFVGAYAPFVDPNAAGSPTFKGIGIDFNGFNGQGVPQYSLIEPWAGRPVEIGWRFAAIYTNWLCNSRRPAGQAMATDFINGAYDTSTFTVGPGGVVNDQATHNSNAQYWIPTRDEWVKAAYWDPNRLGLGQGGYWDYPITSNTAPVPGAPVSGGQTNTGPFPPGQIRPLDVGSYPTVQSPWGLLDCSGGLREWMENRDSRGFRFTAGSSSYDSYDPFDPTETDKLVWTYAVGAGLPQIGFRIASLVPGPSTGLVLVVLGSLTHRSRRRPPCNSHSLESLDCSLL